MESKQVFLKELETYLDIELSEFDGKRILGYLDEYVGSLPEQKPEVITKIKTVYKFIADNEQKQKELIVKDIAVTKPSEIVSLVSSKTGISFSKMVGRQRYSDIVLARHVAMYFINTKCHESLVKTGQMFHRDHTSVINAVRNVRNMIEGENQKYSELFKYVLEAINHPIKQSA
jgi:chromosomal replication initiation ATPase DnaA